MSNNQNNHTSNNGKPMLRPAIIIGPGGTGNQVVRRLKQFVQDQYGTMPSLLSFLVIDTDESTFNDQNWVPLPALSDNERLSLYDSQVPFMDVRDNPGAYPEIHDWLPASLDVGLLDHQQGAGQVRMLGRMGFYKSFSFFARRLESFFTRCQQIQTLLAANQQYDFNVETDPVVYLVSSVCGGQGAGSFIDAAVAIRALAKNRFPRLNLVGILTLPSVYAEQIPRENWSKVCANTHAALKEVDYLMHSSDKSKMRFRFPGPLDHHTITPSQPLFDVCYLVDNRHQRGALNRPEEVYDQIATQLFLEIGTPFGARSDSVRINLTSVAGLELDTVFHTGRRYSGFGNHTISFSREKIVEFASMRSAYTTIHDKLVGQTLTTIEMEAEVTDFVSRHRIEESQTDDLVNTLVTSSEISHEQVSASYLQDRPNHATLANDLWSRLDAFWLRRASDLRGRMERRARTKLDGQNEDRGILAAVDETLDSHLRAAGVAAGANFAEALLSRLRMFETLMRAENQEHSTNAQRLRQEAETARTELLSIHEQMVQLSDAEARVNLFSRVWKTLGFAVTLGFWRPGAAAEEDRARQFSELSLRAQDQRNQLLRCFNQSVEHRLASEARDVASALYAEAANRLAQAKDRIEQVKSRLEKESSELLNEHDRLTAEVKRNPFIDGNTMRRDVTGDYSEQYYQMHVMGATSKTLQYLLPQGQPALDSLEAYANRAEIYQHFYDQYAEDILRRGDRDSLAEMIDRFHTHHLGGSLTDKIAEALQFCLPFWDMRMPGGQCPTEVLLVGLEQDNPAVQNCLTDHAAAQRGQVYPQVVPTGQDSVILISRVAHGASYYWHAQDEAYFREYFEALDNAPYPLHLRHEWRKLPEPIPDPSKYERRVFALGIAYEFIAIRGTAFYLDPSRRFSLVGTSRQTTPDWQTIPLLEATALSDSATAPANPGVAEMLDDDKRTEVMQKFVDASDQVSIVRTRLNELFSQDGRINMRRQIERYAREVLLPAINELGADDKMRDQLDVELASLQEISAELEPASGGLKLSR